MSHSPKKQPVALSIGILAWNEEHSIQGTLESLFRQSVFERLSVRHERCEVAVVAHGCTDRTAAVVRAFLGNVEAAHEWSESFTARVIEIPEAGKAHAWNRFVHEFSAVEARYLTLMDADIGFHQRETIFNLLAVLERRPRARASTGRQCKDLLFKESRTLRERLALATSAFGEAEYGALCRQLYCLRTEVARNLFMPRELGATEGEFIEEIVATNFLRSPRDPGRIVLAPEAAHIYRSCSDARDVLASRQRRIIGQTAVHVLVEFLKTLPCSEDGNFAEQLRRQEARDPDWLKKLIAAHLRRRPFFWQIVPGILRRPFLQGGTQKPGLRTLTRRAAALAEVVVTSIACARASHALRTGLALHWPPAGRETILSVPQGAK